MRILTGHPSTAKVAFVLVIGSAFTVDPASTKLGGAAELRGYPPNGFRKIEAVVEAPNGKFRIEQWWKRGGATGGQDLYQTWLVPKTGNPIHLPEVPLPPEWEVGDSGSVGFPSTFSLSPDAVYLFREQKSRTA
jgi:hypothetical protein